MQRILEILATSASVDFLVRDPEPRRVDPSHRYWSLLRDAGVTIVDSRFYGRLPLWCESQPRPYDWIVAEFWHQAEVIAKDVATVRQRQPGVRFAVDTVDVHYLREHAALRCGSADYGTAVDVEARKQRELATYRSADLLVACSSEDATSLAADVSGCHALVIPNIVKPLRRSGSARDKSLIFIGGFRHQPNVDAITWFVREVWPIVRARLPDVELQIIGSHAPTEVEDLQRVPGVRMVGFVEDTATWLDKAAVSIAPLRYGAGMKGKVTEALSAGVPVVTTTVGAQGLGAESGVHLHIADTAPAFAEAVVACLTDPPAAEAMGKRGQDLVESICGMERVRRDLEAALRPRTDDRAAPAARHDTWSRATAWLRCRLWILRCLAARVKNSVVYRMSRRWTRATSMPARQEP